MGKNSVTVKSNNSLLPDNIGKMSINELLSQPNSEISKKGNVLKVKNKTPQESVMLEVRTYPDLVSVTQHIADKTKPVSQQSDTIMRLRKEGKTQTETADILGTTQSNIAKIEKRMKSVVN